MKLHSQARPAVRTLTMREIGRFTLRAGPIVVLYLAFGSGVVAAPETFKAGDTLSASKINANFKDANDRLTILEKQINANNKYAANAVFCKATLGSTMGDMTGLGGAKGYAGAKAACQTTCDNSPTAHMCTADEIVRSAVIGVTLKQGWFAGGLYDTQGGAGDCQSFTSPGGSGNFWYVPPLPNPSNTPEYASVGSCSNNYPVLCCDAPK